MKPIIKKLIQKLNSIRKLCDVDGDWWDDSATPFANALDDIDEELYSLIKELEESLK